MKPRRERQERAVSELSYRLGMLSSHYPHSGWTRVAKGTYVSAENLSRWWKLYRELQAVRQRLEAEHFELTG